MARAHGRFDADTYDEDHRQHCPGCRTCDRIDAWWDNATEAQLAAAHGYGEAGE